MSEPHAILPYNVTLKSYITKGEEYAKLKDYEMALALMEAGEFIIMLIRNHSAYPATSDILKKSLLQQGKKLFQIREQARKALQEYNEEFNEAMDTSEPGKIGNQSRKTPEERRAEITDKDTAELWDQMLSSTRVTNANVSWDDIAGLEDAKQNLYEAIILPRMQPQLFTGGRKPWKGILLYGPPGTGKSFLAKAAATALKGNFFSVGTSDLLNKYVGGSAQRVKTIFELARAYSPSVIFIDELEDMCADRSKRSSNNGVIQELLVNMDGLGGGDERVLVIGATNLPQIIDPAIMRRFERRIYIPLPDAKARRSMFIKGMMGQKNTLSEADITALTAQSDGYSGSDITTVLKDTYMAPFRELRKYTHFKLVLGPSNNPNAEMQNIQEELYEPAKEGEQGAVPMTVSTVPENKLRIPPITPEMVFESLNRSKRTVSIDKLAEYERFTNSSGQSGA
jgi:vacuolar protein-sorting-associated protein 4